MIALVAFVAGALFGHLMTRAHDHVKRQKAAPPPAPAAMLVHPKVHKPSLGTQINPRPRRIP